MLEIVNAPSPVLSQVAKPVGKIDRPIVTLIDEMKLALISAVDPIGVGLAAPQVGKSIRLFITKPNPKSKSFSVFINPQIIEIAPEKKLSKAKSPKSGKKTKKLEGCLSLKNIWGEVKRAQEVKLSYTDEKGKNHIKNFKGFMTTIILHELDHLNGVLFPKRVLEQKGTLYKSEKDENDEDVFEEMKI